MKPFLRLSHFYGLSVKKTPTFETILISFNLFLWLAIQQKQFRQKYFIFILVCLIALSAIKYIPLGWTKLQNVKFGTIIWDSKLYLKRNVCCRHK